MWQFGEKINALIVFAEHRYYGKSLPFGNDSMIGRDHFGYLSTEQALADFAELVVHLNQEASTPRSVISIGGSHGANLAAFFRMKYPHLVAGALASSSTLKKFSNITSCDKYSQIITSTFKNAYNEHCTENIKKSWTVLKDVAFAEYGVQFFNEVFNFCEPWKAADPVNNFIYELNSIYWHMAMTNYPYEADVYTFLPANPIRKFCSNLDENYDGQELVKALRRALDVYANPKGEKKCFEFPKRRLMQESDQKAWSFQRCTELITGMCEGTNNNMFPPDNNNLQEEIKGCKSTYDLPVERYVNRIRDHFGVEKLKTATNIIFSNGLLDPWSAAGVLRTPNDESIVINIPEGAHHIDLRYSNPLDPPSVTQAREVEELYLKKWIRQFRRKTYNFM
ncbi:lysosomal Pro-X carboxypeptidase-like isoform X2 [Episyrphus balteatus]|nr:lysosomal Pro-X carboxypeptidase-like isoform X2 [Episyrphus balteatus]XP_055851395.1 lysosomal Pro-X carboxypeptidase-like isoform X2 [Episyrphus balteatus]